MEQFLIPSLRPFECFLAPVSGNKVRVGRDCQRSGLQVFKNEVVHVELLHRTQNDVMASRVLFSVSFSSAAITINVSSIEQSKHVEQTPHVDEAVSSPSVMEVPSR